MKPIDLSLSIIREFQNPFKYQMEMIQIKMFENTTQDRLENKTNLSSLNVTNGDCDKENHDAILNALVIAVSAISITCCMTSLAVITQCQRMPRTIKYLSSNFIVCFMMIDFVILLHSVAMLCWGDLHYHLIFNSRIFFCCTFGTVLWCSLVSLTYERLVALVMPLKYIKYGTRTNMILAIICTWVVNVVVPITIFAISGIQFYGSHDNIYLCDNYTLFRPIKVVLACLMIAYGFSIIVAYVKILAIIFQHNNVKKVPVSIRNILSTVGNQLKNLHSTKTIVAIISAFIVLQSPIFFHLIIFELRPDFQNQNWRVILQCLDYTANQLNMYASLYLYIWKLKECRMRFYLMFSNCSSRLQQKASEMRFEVFDIITIQPPCSPITRQSSV